jgi:2-polyprenyl-6-methoxyphenol hydroxylase-like FAD-dependent oxidoreductase
VAGQRRWNHRPPSPGLFKAGSTVDRSEAREFNRDREANFRDALRSWTKLDDIVHGTEREGPLRVMANWHSDFRESAGPEWVLIGDAGHFKDFTPAQGITDALRQAKSLSTVIRATLGSAAAQDEALSGWWRHRDRSSYDMYWFAQQMGRPGASSPLITEVLRRVADDPDGAATLLKVLNRDVPSAKLFTTPRLLAAAYTTLRNYPDHRRTTFAEIGGQVATEIDKRRGGLRSSIGVHRRAR